jgi:hypothetical protein
MVPPGLRRPSRSAARSIDTRGLIRGALSCPATRWALDGAQPARFVLPSPSPSARAPPPWPRPRTRPAPPSTAPPSRRLAPRRGRRRDRGWGPRNFSGAGVEAHTIRKGRRHAIGQRPRPSGVRERLNGRHRLIQDKGCRRSIRGQLTSRVNPQEARANAEALGRAGGDVECARAVRG